MKRFALFLLLMLCSCTPYWKITPSPEPSPVIATVTAPVVSASTAQELSSMHRSQYIVTGNANVRSCASVECDVVGYVYAGDTVSAKCTGDWCEISSGFVYSPCLGFPGVCR